MATSSIIENIRVNNPQLLEEYVEAMEKGVNLHHVTTGGEFHSSALTDPNRIKALVEGALAKRGTKS